jgi:hypothetical protein
MIERTRAVGRSIQAVPQPCEMHCYGGGKPGCINQQTAAGPTVPA